MCACALPSFAIKLEVIPLVNLAGMSPGGMMISADHRRIPVVVDYKNGSR